MRAPPSLPPVRFLAVFRANIRPPSESILLLDEPNCSVELTPGPISFSYCVPIVVQKPPSAQMTLGQRPVHLPVGSYWLIEAQGDSSRQGRDSLWKEMALLVAETIGVIELRYPGLVGAKIYEGAVNTPGSVIFMPPGPLELVASPDQDPEEATSTLSADLQNLQALPFDSRQRYRLASRWFRRGRETLNQIDKFLFFWMTIEIYPAEGSGRKVPEKTCEFLHRKGYSHLTVSEIKAKTGLPRMHRIRGDIVHKGKSFVDAGEENIFSDYLSKLESVAVTCLRILVGLPPGSDLDKYLRPDEACNEEI